MNCELQELDFIDLISERHVQLRSIIEKLWNDTSDIYISISEWYIMARVYKKRPTISYVTKHVDISRQATHKFIKSLESKGLVIISSLENNKKDRCIQLTKLGEECYEENKSLKANLEKKVIDKIGYEKFQVLNDILKLDWGL
ncbi:MarR family winged helix-turn-helix transcriptional regulator [Paenisporosarcina indica]|uniref:MarR family winged helix-turn-helix transcriptional regulator n=1 Tax=Paenisporosarcina indica TaxID=650093 RepID=UPI00094FA79C|nr:MarR family transcriptional regulator [Paenisporosarcina indica]